MPKLVDQSFYHIEELLSQPVSALLDVIAILTPKTMFLRFSVGRKHFKSVLQELRSTRLDDRDSCGTLFHRIGNLGCLNVACVYCLYHRMDAIWTRCNDTTIPC